MGLKLEVGKYYKTRDGRKVGPLTYHSDEIESYRWQVQGLDLNGTVAAWFDSGAVYSTHTSPHDLIAEWTDAPTGPVRTVTRKEIVPGVYGRIRVDAAIDWDKVLIGFDRSHLDDDRIKHGTLMQPMDAKQLRALAETATALADALEYL